MKTNGKGNNVMSWKQKTKQNVTVICLKSKCHHNI